MESNIPTIISIKSSIQNFIYLPYFLLNMLIKELQPKQGNIDIKLDVVEVGEVREFQKFGKSGKVATARAKDEEGALINMTLWNEDIDKVKAGDKVHLTNGYANEWQGELQLTTGRMGKLEVIGKADIKEEPKEDEASPDVDEEEVK